MLPAPRRAHLGLWGLVALLACGPTGAPAGAPCRRNHPEDCASRMCLAITPVQYVCTRRCTDRDPCTDGDVCGLFDFRARDPDSGLPSGVDFDIVRVCRPPLNTRCSATCAATETCFGDVDGVCTTSCSTDLDCLRHTCVRSGCEPGRCAPPCDSIAECPRFYTCDLTRTDGAGHGECIPIAPEQDAGPPTDASGTCMPDGA